MAASLLLLTAGCFGSHGAPEGEPPPTSDAGTMPDDPPDDPPSVVPPDPGPEPPITGCRESGPARNVVVELESEFGARCEYGRFAGAALYDLSARPELDGISMLVDFCPDADDDCMCDVVVSGIGTDMLDDISGATGGPFSGEVHPNGIVLERPCDDGACTDGTCACVPTLVLAAVDGSVYDPPVTTDAVSVAVGEEVCRIADSGECDFVMWSLEAIVWTSGFPGAIGTTLIVEQGQTAGGEDFTGLTVRGLRASGYDCGGELPRAAAWAAWGTFEGV